MVQSAASRDVLLSIISGVRVVAEASAPPRLGRVAEMVRWSPEAVR